MKSLKYSIVPIITIPMMFLIYGIRDTGVSSGPVTPNSQAVKKSQPKISAAKGHKIAQSNGCFSCHSTDGSEMDGPTWKNLYGSKVQLKNDSTVIADSSYIAESIKKPTADVVKGFSPTMPSFSYLSNTKIKSIIAYIKSISNKKDSDDK